MILQPLYHFQPFPLFLLLCVLALSSIICEAYENVTFEDIEKSMAQLLDLCQLTLFDWSWCWDLSDCSTIIDFLLSLRIGF